MRKITMYSAIQILVLLCILLGSPVLTTENARAAEEPLNDDVASKKLEEAKESFNDASAKRNEALKDLSLIKAQNALLDAEKAAEKLTELSSSLMGRIDMARMTADIAGLTSSVVRDLVGLPRQAVPVALAFTGPRTGNIGIAERSLDVAEGLCKLVWSIDRMASERCDPELKQTVRMAAQSIRFTIREVANTADYIAATSQIPDEVDLATELKDRSQNIQYCIIDEEEGLPPCIGPDCDPYASPV